MGCSSSKNDAVSVSHSQSRPASLPPEPSSSSVQPKASQRETLSSAPEGTSTPSGKEIVNNVPQKLTVIPTPPPPPPPPLQSKEVVTKFQPTRGLTIITEKETGKEKLYILLMHHSSVETFICMEPKVIEVSSSVQPTTCYVFVISSAQFRQLCKDEEVKSQLCTQIISHINQLYNARANYKVYRTELASQ